MTSHAPMSSLLLLAGLVAACSDPTNVQSMPEDGIHHAVVEWDGERDIRVPDLALLDEPAKVEVSIWVGGSVAPLELSVLETEEGFRIDATADYGSGWLDRWAPAPLSVELQFTEAGLYEVEVVGRSMPGYTEISHIEQIEVVAPQ